MWSALDPIEFGRILTNMKDLVNDVELLNIPTLVCPFLFSSFILVLILKMQFNCLSRVSKYWLVTLTLSPGSDDVRVFSIPDIF